MASRKATDTVRSTGGRPSGTKAGNAYCPDAGDFIWLDLDPTKGHEQRGRRPALVLSPRGYNARAGLCIAFPVTNKAKGYPFEVVTGGGHVTGVVLADQPRSLAWGERNAGLIGRAGPKVLDEVRAKLAALIGAD
jgi:mRNA interferase MazF